MRQRQEMNTRLRAPRGLFIRRARHDTWLACVMLLPTCLILIVFFFFPLGTSLVLSFTNARLFGTPRFIGLANYTRALRDTTLYQALSQTAIFTIAVVTLSTVLALGLAVLLNERLRGRVLFRTLCYLPVVASVVGTALVWRYLLNQDFGLVNAALSIVGVSRVEWLTSARVALWSVILVTVWKTIGTSLVLFLAGLQSVPQPLYEAASIDGATRWQQFRHVTLPLLSPITFFVLVTTAITCLQAFDVPFALGQSGSNTVGPADSMLTVVALLYREGFDINRKGYAAALAWLLLLIVMGLTWVQFRAARRWVHYD